MIELIRKSRVYSSLVKLKIKMMRIGTEGYVLMFHRVADKNPKALSPNEEMKVTPEFLDRLIRDLKEDYDIIPSERINERLKKRNNKKFIVLTLDDGYKDNFTNAYPIFTKHEAPFTIFVASCFPMMEAVNWWFGLERLIMDNTSIVLSYGEIFSCRTYQEKETAFMQIREKILGLEQRNILYELNKLFSEYSINWMCDNKTMCISWDDLRILTEDPLVTIGAHTFHHYNLKALPSEDAVREEVEMGINCIKEHLGGYTPKVFAYPYGSSHEVGQREIKVLSEMSFKYAFVAYGVAGVTRRSAKFSLPRWTVNEGFELKREIEK